MLSFLAGASSTLVCSPCVAGTFSSVTGQIGLFLVLRCIKYNVCHLKYLVYNPQHLFWMNLDSLMSFALVAVLFGLRVVISVSPGHFGLLRSVQSLCNVDDVQKW